MNAKPIIIATVSAFLSITTSYSDVYAFHTPCNTVITSDTVMDADLSCTASGITIQGDNIVLDCNNHIISSDPNTSFYSAIKVMGNNNIIKNCVTDGFQYGIYIDASHNEITGNTIRNAKKNGIKVYSNLNKTNNNNIIHNNFIETNSGGIIIEVLASNNIVADNILYNGKSGGMYIYGYNTVVERNIISGCMGIGISVGNSGIVARDNTISNCSSNGIYLSGNSSIISGNNISNNALDGILVYNLSNSDISNNTITQHITPGIYGIFIAPFSSANTIKDNTISNNWRGIKVYNSNSIANNMISGNNIKNNINLAIWIEPNPVDNSIYNNNFINNFGVLDQSPQGSNTWDNGVDSGNYWDNDNNGMPDTYLEVNDRFPLGNLWRGMPPEAVAGSDFFIFLGETANLDASGSSDPENDPIVSYNWSVISAPAGSSSILSDISSVSPSLTPDLQGEYILSLTVSDGTNTSPADTIIITATQNLPPVALAEAPMLSGVAPFTAYFSAINSYDPESGVLTFIWKFGDPLSGADNSSLLDSPAHTFVTPGVYTVILTVTDDFGYTGEASLSVTVTAPNMPPTLSPSADNYSGSAPLNVFFTSNGNDPDGDLLTYSWDFGDGSSISNEANPAHTYTAMGAYKATVTVADQEYSTSASLIISVGSNLTISIKKASIKSDKKRKYRGKIKIKADFDYSGILATSDIIKISIDDITLFEKEFGSFKEDKRKSEVYEFEKKGIKVKIDLHKGTIKFKKKKVNLTEINISDGIDVVISFGGSTGTDHFEVHKKDKKDKDRDNQNSFTSTHRS